MGFLELARERYSVRKFTSQRVEQEKLDLILEAWRVAPTGCNIQPQKVYVIQSDEALEMINNVCDCIFGATTVLMITNDTSREWKNPLEEGVSAGVQDVSIVATHMMLEAWELGIGSCWVNFFSPTRVSEVFQLPENEQVVLLMPIGYKTERAHPAHLHFESHPIEDLVCYL